MTALTRGHVIRLNTTPNDEVYFRQACGVARHAYNWALAHWKAARVEGKRVKLSELKAKYNRIKHHQFPWTSNVTKCAPEQAFADLGQAFANYWRMKAVGTQPKLKHPRKVGGSQNWWEQARKLAKAHYRATCQREDSFHQMTTKVAAIYSLIGLEDLNTKGM